MSTLHVLSHSPFSDSRLSSCLRLLNPGDGMLLCGDAVYALQDGTAQRSALELMPETIALLALAEDVHARGLVQLPERLQQLDYPGFVASSIAFDKVNSWL